ncbi:MAG: type II secretion system protein [Marinobacterium sp.]
MTRHYQKGGSLLELTLVLVIMGAMGASTWLMLPRIMAMPALQRLLSSDMQIAETALRGYIHLHGELPCPATGPGGGQSCSGSQVGWLPERTLGIVLEHPLRYRVAGDSSVSLTQIPRLYTPKLLSGEALPASGGLDFCRALQGLATAGEAAPLRTAINDLPVAYALIDAGEDAAGDTTLQDADNRNPDELALEGEAKRFGFDDRQRVVGPLELHAQLGCTQSLSRTQVAVLSANAAYDLDRMAEEYVEFREFVLRVRRFNEDAAETDFWFATANMAIAAASQASAISVAVNTDGLTAKLIGMAAANVAVASVQLGFAAKNWSDTGAETALAVQHLMAARAYKFHTSAQRSHSRNRVIASLLKGIEP